MKSRTILRANDGKVLTNGTTYGRVIYLAEGDDGSKHYEITEAEYDAIVAERNTVIDRWIVG